ncbi:unnamed protein product [Nippostrongylus brasiliensis]|uniref:Uncharacterized protein n=1 Tax=Nippostrongylus brasiliensis TaxID=27835 RepID=A0A0N4Y7P0_NIPBR|nr:unnamed protein product [Nippostrongylus brasiliensis]
MRKCSNRNASWAFPDGEEATTTATSDRFNLRRWLRLSEPTSRGEMRGNPPDRPPPPPPPPSEMSVGGAQRNRSDDETDIW